MQRYRHGEQNDSINNCSFNLFSFSAYIHYIHLHGYALRHLLNVEFHSSYHYVRYHCLQLRCNKKGLIRVRSLECNRNNSSAFKRQRESVSINRNIADYPRFFQCSSNYSIINSMLSGESFTTTLHSLIAQFPFAPNSCHWKRNSLNGRKYERRTKKNNVMVAGPTLHSATIFPRSSRETVSVIYGGC